MNLIPLDHNKRPKVSKWREVENYQKHTALVKTDGSEMYGVLTGHANGIVVFDYDTKKEGEHVGKVIDNEGIIYDAAKLKSIYGDEAYIVKTRSGGFHVYCLFEHDSPTQTTGVNGCLDVRAEGGYVVGGNSPGYEVVNGDINRLVAVPDVIHELCSRAKPKQKNLKKSVNIKNEIDNQELVKILENNGFSDVRFTFMNSPYNFICDEIGKECPLCGNTHESNCFFYWTGKCGELFVKNHSSKCKQKSIVSYEAMKYAFEKRVCRVNDTLVYVANDGYEDVMYNKSGLEERFMDWRCPEVERGDFVKAWLKDKNKSEYRKMDFFPENCPEDVFNLWRGYAIEDTHPDLGKSGTIEPFMKLLDALTGHDTKYALDYFSLLFQFPNTKPMTCLVFTGKQGTGKGRLYYPLAKIMGSHLFYETSNAEQDVFGLYADAFDRTKLVVLNESQSKVTFKHSERLKALITDEDGLRVRKPYMRQYPVRNLAGVIICTNENVPLLITNDDRRVALYHTLPTFKNDHAFFSEYMAWADEPANLRALYDFLMSRDISNVDWGNDRPKNAAYAEVRNSCLPVIVKWFEYLIVEHFPESFEKDITGKPCDKHIKSSKLLQHFLNWNTREERVSDASFGLKMKKAKEDYDIPDTALKGVHRNDGKYWYLDRANMFAWLRDHGFTNYNDEELPCSISHQYRPYESSY